MKNKIYALLVLGMVMLNLCIVFDGDVELSLVDLKKAIAQNSNENTSNDNTADNTKGTRQKKGTRVHCTIEKYVTETVCGNSQTGRSGEINTQAKWLAFKAEVGLAANQQNGSSNCKQITKKVNLDFWADLTYCPTNGTTNCQDYDPCNI